MDNDYDPEREADAAMKFAAATDGLERQRWISLAMAWQQIARMRLPSTSGDAEEVAWLKSGGHPEQVSPTESGTLRPRRQSRPETRRRILVDDVEGALAGVRIGAVLHRANTDDPGTGTP